MVQPIQYQIPGALNPFENLVSGLKLGATMADMDAARAQQQAATQLAQQKALAEQAAVEQKALADAEISAYLAKPTDQRTQEDTRKLVRFLPAAQIQNLMAADATLSDKQRENQIVFAGQVGSALKAKNPEVAINIVRERFDAEQDPQKKQGLKLLLDSIEKAPDLALETLRMSTLALGDKYEKAANAMFGTPAAAADGGKTISSSADKISANLVDADGKPLPGTFFLKTGQAPQLVKGEEGAKPAPPSEVMRLFSEISTLETGGAPKNDPRILALRDKIKKETQFPPTAPSTVIKLGDQERAELGERGKMLVGQYKDISNSARLAAKTLPSIDANLGILNEGFETGFGTPTKAAAAKVLSALGVDNAEKFAAKAEIFQAKASEMVLQKQLDQKGPQTESDARRLEQTISQLGNTKKGNQFLLATAKEQLKRDIEQRNFYDKWWKQNSTYDGAEDAWYAGDGGKSLFDRPALLAFALKESSATQIPTQGSVTPTQPIVDRRQPTPTGVRRQIAPGVFVTERP